MYMRLIGAGNVEPDRLRSGREQQSVESKVSSIRQHDAPGVGVDCGRLGAKFELDRLLRIGVVRQDPGLNAGAPTASPVRRLKQAWCQGQRTVSETTSPSANGPP